MTVDNSNLSHHQGLCWRWPPQPRRSWTASQTAASGSWRQRRRSPSSIGAEKKETEGTIRCGHVALEVKFRDQRSMLINVNQTRSFSLIKVVMATQSHTQTWTDCFFFLFLCRARRGDEATVRANQQHIRVAKWRRRKNRDSSRASFISNRGFDCSRVSHSKKA